MMAEEDMTTAVAPATDNSSTTPTQGGFELNQNSLIDAAGLSTSSSPSPAANDDPSPPPPPPDDPSPPESTPTPDPPPPPDSSPPPPPPSPPPPTPSSSPPPPQPSPPPPATTTASPPPPVDDSSPPPITPQTDSPPPPINPETPSSQLPPPSPSSDVPAETTSSPSPPRQAVPNDKPSSSSSSSGTTRSPRTGGGSPGKGSTSEDASPASSTTNNSGLIVALVVTCAIILALVIIGVICCCKRKKKKQMYSLAPGGGHIHGQHRPSNRNMPGDHIVKLPPPPGGGGIPSGDYSFGYTGIGPQNQGLPLSPNMGLGVNTCSFTYQDLSAATGGFSEANVIGQGGYGFVYKGVLPNGKEVAVKSLKAGSGQGDREFQAEVEIISRVHHRYLVSLVGYCIADGQRILVYDFVPNKTLEYHLHGNSQVTMDWGTRLKIATGSAKGLAYLHEDCHPRIIHRDIKAANILIDYNFEAQVADFGLAKLTVNNNTHVSTRVMGTFGYLAPEYASSGKLSEKSDVFSFGVMLLELITGRRPVDHTGKIMEDSLVDWARPHLAKAQEDGNYNEIADPRMEGKYDHNEMARMVACASSSVRHSARRRPKMSQIVRALEGDLSFEALNDSRPEQGMGANGNDSSPYDTGEYNADMLKFRKMVMSGQDLNSSEYGDTSEYGLNPSVSSNDSREMGSAPAKPRF